MAEVARELEVRARGLTLRGLRWGPQGGRRVLALHGWLDNAASFAPLVECLPSCDFRALELPGHGHSDHHGQDADYHLVDYLQDVGLALDGWGWDQCHLLGHSMGAVVAALFAGAFAERASSLVSIDALGPLAEADELLPARIRQSAVDRRRRAQRAVRVYPSVGALAEQMRRVVPNLSASAAAGLAARGSAPVEAPNGGVRPRADDRLRVRSQQWLTERQVRAFLAQIQAPVLAIRAAQGYPFDPEVLHARAACIARLRRRELPGGHHLHMDCAQQVAAEVADFWATEAAAGLGPPAPS